MSLRSEYSPESADSFERASLEDYDDDVPPSHNRCGKEFRAKRADSLVGAILW